MPKIDFRFTDNEHKRLKNFAIRRGTPMTDVVKNAIGLAIWWQDQLDAGKVFLVEYPDGHTERVVIVK
jgi:hypothetical protein